MRFRSLTDNAITLSSTRPRGWRAALGRHEHRIMHVDLGSLGGSALTDPAIAIPEQRQRRDSGDLRAGAQHRAVVPGTGVGGSAGGRGTLSSASTPSITPDIRIAVRNSSPRSQRLAQLATRAGVEGGALQLHAPLLALEQGAHHPRRACGWASTTR